MLYYRTSMIYQVTVKPHSCKGPLVVEAEEGLIVYLQEKPIDGEANHALINLLAKHFHVGKTRITIKSGQHGRHKLIEIAV